ncbi:MAG TPA: site-specific integrase [Euzebya sp.]|nr:site-specific integrase [Euzebya sp.]
MTALAPALPLPAAESLVAKLSRAVRPEFQAELIGIDVDNPVFARGRCSVEGCDRGAWSRLLCGSHYNRWRLGGRPDMDVFCATTGLIVPRLGSEHVDTFDLRRLSSQLRLEVGYSIQCRHDDRTVRLIPEMIRQFVDLLATTDVTSLLDRPIDDWVADAIATGRAGAGSRTVGQLRYAYMRLIDLAEDIDADSEYARDTWRANVLGVPTLKGVRQVHFGEIAQLWLRGPVKRYARFRLATGKAFSSVEIDVRAVRWFSRFLTDHHRDIAAAEELTRGVIEHYLSWMASQPLAGHTSNTLLVCLRGFLDTCRRYDWMPGLPMTAAIYLDELPSRPRPLPRFIPEFVMAQIDNPDSLAVLPDDTTRHLLVLIIETGLRANDACTLPFNPIIDDSVGWSSLKFFNHKMKTEQLIPLSPRAADTIRAQQAHLRDRWSDPPTRLFPSPHCNPDGTRAFSYATLRARLAVWQDRIGIRDEAGQPVRITAHQFRHTLGTRMINNGVPQHVVQRLLGHASPQMTARYATLHDTTVRAAFDDYQTRRVDIHGQRLDFDPDGPTADAEWIKHNLARIQASLPNGYCGRPPQQDCPHPNACLTCPDFQTTPEFLPIHRRQRDDTLTLIDAAQRDGRDRQAANHQQVLTNLQTVIDGLEAIDQEPQP